MKPATRSSCCRVVQRTEVGVGDVEPTDLLALRLRDEQVDEPVVDRRRREDTRRGRAVLARVVEAGNRNARGGGFEVGVVAHDDRRVAAELEVHALEVGRGRGRDLHTRAHAAGDRDETGDRVRDERTPGVAVAAHDVEHTGREELGRELGEHHGGLGRGLGRLQHDGVPGGERGRDLPDRHHQRVVPRRDLRDHPDRLAADERREPRHVLGRGASFEHPGRAREEADLVDRGRDLVGGHQRLGLPGAAAFGVDEPIGVALERVGDAQQREAALRRRLRRARRRTRSGRPPTASSTSAAADSGPSRRSGPVHGSTRSVVAPSRASTDLPFTKFWTTSMGDLFSARVTKLVFADQPLSMQVDRCGTGI